jgi:NADH:ubiquinone oxidoreductase subunit 6 (subunit J)
LGTILFCVLNVTFAQPDNAPLNETIKPLGKALFGDPGYLLTVEIAAVLLLSAILGAIAVIREK